MLCYIQASTLTEQKETVHFRLSILALGDNLPGNCMACVVPRQYILECDTFVKTSLVKEGTRCLTATHNTPLPKINSLLAQLKHAC